MLEKSNPNQPKNNITLFARTETRNKINKIKMLEVWKKEGISSQIIDSTAQIWQPEHDQVLQIYLKENDNIMPTLVEFSAYVNREMRKILDKDIHEIKKDDDGLNVVLYDIIKESNKFDNLSTEEKLEPLFGEIDEDLDFSQISILTVWKEEYDTLNNKYLENIDLKTHTSNIKILLEKIELSYKDSEKNPNLAKYLGRFLLKIQRELALYTKELKNNLE